MQTKRSDERPRERLLRGGAQALSDAELLAVLLRNGCSGVSASELARDLLRDARGLESLARSDRAFLRRHGVGDAKVSTLLAAFELARRLARVRVTRRSLLNRPTAVADFLHSRYGSADQEIMGAVYLDIRNHMIEVGDIFRGTLSKAAVEPRAILKGALMHNASGLILFHTHPSGDPAPSSEDLAFTRRIAQGGELLGIRLVDHMIIGSHGRWVSLQRRGAW